VAIIPEFTKKCYVLLYNDNFLATESDILLSMHPKIKNESESPIVLGVDGGGTSTKVAILGLDGSLLATAMSGPSNYDDVGIDTAKANIAAAIRDAAGSIGKQPNHFAAAFFGMAGVISPADRAVIATISDELEIAPSNFVGIDHDIRIALAGGLCGGEGIALIAGTGSSCYGENQEGESWRCGGWGHLLDDGGSSYDIGRRAMVALVRSVDGRLPSFPIGGEIMAAINIESSQQILRRIHHDGLSRSEIAALARLVTKSADNGDKASQQIINEAVEDLALLVETTARVLFKDGNPNVVLLGGIAESSDIYRRAVVSAINRRCPGVDVVKPKLPAVIGAGLLALRQLGVADEELCVRLQNNWERWRSVKNEQP
jgi:N-acetylglucosamine kinase-like BadF-type ATPase